MNAGPLAVPDGFREAMASFPSGTTIVTTSDAGGGWWGFTASSFCSVSLEPPLILFCPAKSSTSWPLIRESGRFCVNVFAEHHGEISTRFAAQGVDRFDGVAWHARASGPALDDAVAWIECTIDAVHEGGDHLIVVGAVDRLDVREGESDPLVFFRGRYGSFAAND